MDSFLFKVVFLLNFPATDRINFTVAQSTTTLRRRKCVMASNSSHMVTKILQYSLSQKFLPPAWGKVIFSLCVSVHTATGGRGGGGAFYLSNRVVQVSTWNDSVPYFNTNQVCKRALVKLQIKHVTSYTRTKFITG